MTVTFCDIAGKRIDHPTTNYSWARREGRYDTLLDKDLSVEGMDKLKAAIAKVLEAKKSFHFMEYKATSRALLEKITR